MHFSKYGLDAKPYNTDNADITWQECTLRTWLNGKFSRVAFTSKERTAILETKVNNGINQGYSKWNTRGGYHTSDRLFLLSYHEAFELFFSSDSERMCTPTDYVIAQDTVVSGWWWLRSPGYSQDVAADVYTDGSLSSRFINSGSGCVRPAFWIDLEADVF